ncbi:MAG: YkvA family protein [Hyphomicrobiales bacterium]
MSVETTADTAEDQPSEIPPGLDGDVLDEDERTQFDQDEARVRRDFWVTARKAAGSIPFMDEVVAAYFCALDRETPFRVRGTLLGALAYFVLPLDGIPDFILGLGFTDDAAVIMGVLALMRAHITDEHRAAARKALLKDQD